MSLIKWEPFSEFDRYFDDRMLSSFVKPGSDLSVDVYEEKGTVVAKMNLPGVKENELDITIENDVLTISGRREGEKETEEKDYYSKEIRRGSFSRSVSLPRPVVAEKATAEYKEGVLSIMVPVVEGTEGRAVKVQIGA